MDKQFLKRLSMAAMFVALVATAPGWLGQEGQKVSAYSAPWVYPGLQPSQSQH